MTVAFRELPIGQHVERLRAAASAERKAKKSAHKKPRRRAWKAWSIRQLKLALAMHDGGLTWTAIAPEFGRRERAVQAAALRFKNRSA